MLANLWRRWRRIAQGSTVAGFGNVVVQVAGDGNTIVTGAAYLRLTRYAGRRRTAGTAFSVAEPLDLLQPYGLAVPWVGRERILSELWRWLEGEAAISIRVVTAPGGGGKTRAALELCEEATRKGWDAGFATASELERFRAAQNASQWGWRRPTLVVVDYAASHAELLAGWLGELADHAGWPGPPLRLLLLERHASPSEGWWRTAFGRGGGDALAVARLLDPRSGPYQLPRLDQAERRALIRAIWELAGSTLDLPQENAELDGRLAAVSWGGEPLFLIIAAVAAVRSGLATALSLSAPDLAQSVAEGEFGRLRRIARAARIDEDLFVHLAAYATLCQGLSRAEAEAAVGAEKAALGYVSGGDPPQLYKALRGALPESGDGVASVVPDVVGEALVLLALGDGSEPAAAAAVLRAGAQAQARVMATVLRMALDYGRLAPQAMIWLDGLAEARENDVAALAAIVDQIPERSVHLRDFAGKWTVKVVDLYEEHVAEHPDLLPQLARQLMNLGTRLTDLGRRGAALRPTEESVALYRQLAERDPESFTGRLAGALTNLAASLWALRQAEPALAAAEEAVRRFEALPERQKESVQSELAIALRNLAAFKRQPRKTRPLFEGAVEISRRVAASGAPAARAELASALGDLATALGDGNDAAIATLGEAVAIWRELATAQPLAFGAQLARALAHLGHLYTVGGRREAAGEAIREALKVYAQVAADEEDVLFFEIGQTYHWMSMDMAMLGWGEAAMAVAREASRRYFVLSARQPDVALAIDLGDSLLRLAQLLEGYGEAEAAHEAVRRALAVLRFLEARGVAKGRHDLPQALMQEANCLRALKRESEALAATGKAVELLRGESEQRPGGRRAELLGEALNAQASLLAQVGERDAALGAAEEAMALQRDASSGRPDMMVALALNNFSNVMSALGFPERALGAMGEALEMMLAVLHDQPPMTVGMLPFFVDNYRRRAEDADREPDAKLLAAAHEAMGTLGGGAAGQPPARSPEPAA